MSATYIWTVVIGMAVANFAIRFPPIAVLSRVALPDWLRRWLSFIPVSVMATLVIGAVARPDGVWLPPAHNPYLLASLATGVIYWRSRSFVGATIAGVLLFVALRAAVG
ncbi:MAG: AzlD domain-containing protein [Coriobacteriia bacterium]|nr:AzlD domain-containing protein [Coriobacteriia bacterium]